MANTQNTADADAVSVVTAKTAGAVRSGKSGGAEDVDGILDERARRTRRRLERLIGIAATEGNALLPLRNGDEIFGAMLGRIRSARHTVDMMTFVYWKGRSPASSPTRSRSGHATACGYGCCWTASGVSSSRRSSWRRWSG